MDAAQLEIRPSPFSGVSSVSYLDKEIEFVPARKPFNGLSYSNGDFKIETLNPTRPLEPSGRIVSTNPSQANGAAKKAVAADAMDGWLDQELSFRVSFQRIGAGLQNLGNTCYLNSVLQCLTYTEPLAAYLQTGKHQSSCRINGFCALCAIQKHVSRALQANGRIVAPKDLVSNLRCISDKFSNRRQEDAHEYMVNLLESMHKCCLPSGVPSESPSAYEKSLVHKIFGGRLRSQVKCLRCNYCSNNFDPFIDLSLEIAKADSVLKALDHFTAAEHLDGGAKQYQCQKCKEKVRALKQLTVHKAPYVLTIHLKRFHAHYEGEKINKNVRFDTTLDLKPFVSGSYEGDLKYSLYGVLVHHGGSTRSGHYYCYVRTSANLWYSLDDNEVSQASLSKVLQQKAYMLFYVRNRDTTLRKRTEIPNREILKEHHALNRGPFSFNQSSLCSAQFSQITEKSGHAVSPCSVISKDMVSIQRTAVNGSAISGSVSKGPSQKDPITIVCDVCPEKPAMPTASNDKVNDNSQIVVFEKDSTSIKNVDLEKDSTSSAVQSLVEPKISHENPDDKIIKIDSMVSGDQSNRTNSQVDPPMETQKSAEDDEKLTQKESAVSTDATTTHNESLQAERVDKKGHSKMKKKHVKYHLIHFGSKALLGVSLGPRKKRMKAKRRSSSTKKDRGLSDMGPSTSESSDLVKVKSHKKKGDREAKRSSVGEGGGRTAQDGAVLASEFQVPKKSGSTTESSQSKSKAIETAEYGKRDTIGDAMMSMLTRGLEETLVAHWDGIDTPPSPPMESDAAGTTIGHVLDEWDEEYDKGKRKKVRLFKHEYGGRNYFQEVASENFKLKKAKLDRARSGNQPFRI